MSIASASASILNTAAFGVLNATDATVVATRIAGTEFSVSWSQSTDVNRAKYEAAKAKRRQALAEARIPRAVEVLSPVMTTI